MSQNGSDPRRGVELPGATLLSSGQPHAPATTPSPHATALSRADGAHAPAPPTMASGPGGARPTGTVFGSPAWPHAAAPPNAVQEGHTVLAPNTVLPGSAWGPAPVLLPPPPPQRKSQTGLIVGAAAGGAVLFVIALLLMVLGSGDESKVADGDEANAPVEAPYGWRPVRGDGFSYSVPASWGGVDVATLNAPGVLVAQTADIGGGDALTFRVTAESFDEDGPAFGAFKAEQLAKAATVRTQRKAVSGSRPAWQIETQWSSWNPPTTVLERFVTNGKRGFVLSCFTSSARFESERSTCDGVIETFRVD